MRTVGVMGDERTYDYAVVLSEVNTSDFMTADRTDIAFVPKMGKCTILPITILT